MKFKSSIQFKCAIAYTNQTLKKMMRARLNQLDSTEVRVLLLKSLVGLICSDWGLGFERNLIKGSMNTIKLLLEMAWSARYPN